MREKGKVLIRGISYPHHNPFRRSDGSNFDVPEGNPNLIIINARINTYINILEIIN